MKIVASTILLFLLGAISISLFPTTAQMHMSDESPGCPFMAHQETMCAMNLANHINVWKAVFLSIAPTLSVFLGVVGVAALLASVAPSFWRSSQPATSPTHAVVYVRAYTYIYRALQELFSDGILHSKVH